MGFESGSIGFRAFYLPQSLPEDHVTRFAKQAAPPLESLGRESISGWVTGRHLLDRHITETTAYHAGYLRLALMKAERKVPAPLLRAECMMAELAELEAAGGEYLRREERARIRKEVTERLLPDMPPHLMGIPIVCGRGDDKLYAGALSDKQVDALTHLFRAAVGITLAPVTPETAALHRKRTSVADVAPTSFSRDCPKDEVMHSIGMDFLTWLWFFSETRGGGLKTGRGEFHIALEGPLTFVMEGAGAHEARLRNGLPLISNEAKTALASGKKLSRARIILVRDDQEWSAELDAHAFVFRGVKLPKGGQVDAVSRFQDRMLWLDMFLEAVLSYYDLFIDERLDPKRWQATVNDICGWSEERTGRR